MSAALDRFREACGHACEGGIRSVITDQSRLRITIRCSCGKEWHWGLFSELKKRQPEGYVEKFFEDREKRKALEAFVNGVLVAEDETIQKNGSPLPVESR